MPICSKCGKTYAGALCSCEFTTDPGLGGGTTAPGLPGGGFQAIICANCGLSFSSQNERDSHICLPESLDNKLRKEREDWWMAFLPTINPNNGGAVSNRCPTWQRIFNWIKTNKGGIRAIGWNFELKNTYTENILYSLNIALKKIPYKAISVTQVRSSYSQSLSGSSKNGSRIEVFRFTTDSSSTREYIFGDFTIILSGSGFNNSGGGAYSWGVKFYLCDSSGNTLTNFVTIDKRISNSGSKSSYSQSITVSGNWNTIDYDLSANTTYKVYAQLYTGTPFDGTATLQWTISNVSPTVKCFIMDKCPKQLDAFGVNRMVNDELM